MLGVPEQLAASPSAYPESTDGRREDNGRGVRELQGRWPGLHWGKWGRCLSSAAAGRPCDRLGTLGRARWRGEDAARGARRPDWREFAGTFGWPDGGSVADRSSGWEWNGSEPGQGAAELLLPRPALGKMQGEAAGRAGEPSGQGEEPPPKGLGGRDLLAQTDPRRPAGQVVGHHLYRQPSAVGGEAAGRHVVQTDAVLEVSYGVLDLGVAAVVGLQLQRLSVVGFGLGGGFG